MKRRVAVAFGLLVACIVSTASADEGASPLQGTPFESGPNAAALPKLKPGSAIIRSTADNSLTPDDRFRLRMLGLKKTHSAAVVLRKITRTDVARQEARLRAFAKSLETLAPSGACDAIVSAGDSHALCTGHVDGPLGKVPVRMPVSSKIERTEAGALKLVITNHAPMEAKPFLGWSEVVAPGGLKVAIELFPTDDGWLEYTRVGVEMSAHEGSAKTISDAMLKLEGWMSRELGKTT
ncbi:MAG: hypothetical protein JST00_36400 [Deltaproteobacteria bacterium]|nr:hypothetical protein [Deltaproteobacteria bacterium]